MSFVMGMMHRSQGGIRSPRPRVIAGIAAIGGALTVACCLLPALVAIELSV